MTSDWSWEQAWVERQIALLGTPEDWRNFPWGVGRAPVSLRHYRREFAQAYKRIMKEGANG